MKHRKLHQRFLIPNARRGRPIPQEEGEEAFGYDTRPQRPVSDATGVDVGGRDMAADSVETVARIAAATNMCDEPECDSETLITYIETAHKYDTLRHAQEVQDARELRKTLTTDNRVKTIRARAKQQHINVSGDLHVIERVLTRAKAAGRREPPSAIRRLEIIEARLDGVKDLERRLDAA